VCGVLVEVRRREGPAKALGGCGSHRGSRK